MIENIFQIEYWLEILPALSISITIITALSLDALLGEPKKYHPLVTFGHLSNYIEKWLNRSKQKHIFSPLIMLKGALAWSILVLPLPLLYLLVFSTYTPPWLITILIDSLILYLAIGQKSLKQHALQVFTPLKAGNLTLARHFTGYLVSRETKELNEEEMSRATVESMLENGHDAVIASIICYLLGGAPLVIIHRLANTLDAMWGYKNTRFLSFGYAAARIDDVLGFISAKCCTLLYAIQQPFLLALKNAYQQGNLYKSHNGGWVMASGATVLHCTLGGNANYHGKMLTSPQLGCGKTVCCDDIPRSVTLVKRASLTLTGIVLFWQLFGQIVQLSSFN